MKSLADGLPPEVASEIHPDWYKNLDATPDATIQVRGERIPVRAHAASGDERARLWGRMTEVWPAYDDYQQRTDRQIPVVVLERRKAPIRAFVGWRAG